MNLSHTQLKPQKRWVIHPPKPEFCMRLASELSIGPFLAQLLVNRGVTELEQAHFFLRGELEQLFSPWLMKDMDKAVDRIRRAVNKKETICIYGDYDVDGITGIALLSRVLTQIGAAHTVYIPQRVTEGYSLNKAAVEKISRQGTGLIVTIDCGITNEAEVVQAQRLGMDVIITDHHTPPTKLPPAYAILNPKQPDCTYPYDSLAGVGVVAKLAQAIRGEEGASATIREHLDLVCLGTVADVLPLTGENRILVKHGLRQLTNSSKLGINLLKEVASIGEGAVSVWDIGFRLAPRLNAAGRIGDPYRALRLLLTDSAEEAERIARQLDIENQQRKALEKQILTDAKQHWEAQAGAENVRVMVLDSPDWHVGVVGIVASKLVEEYHLPTVLICSGTEPAKGSARSIPQFHLYEALTDCQAHLVAYGGHKCAAGLTIKRTDIPAFKNKLNRIASEKLTVDDLNPELVLDGELRLKDLNSNIMAEIAQLAPFGVSNPTPTFCARGVLVMKYPYGVGQSHLKLKLCQGQSVLDGIGFNMGDLQQRLCKQIDSPVDIAFQPQINDWGGKRQFQLKLKDIQFA